MKRRSKYNRIKDIDPDEIFLDSENLPNFNKQQFEGRLEKPIPKRSIIFLSSFFVIVLGFFVWRTVDLQIVNGEAYLEKSENNTLNKHPIFADRGLIYDRNGVLLAWNKWPEEDLEKMSFPKRAYYSLPGFSHLLGYTSAPAKDSAGFYWQDRFVGKDGVEKYYDEKLTGQNGVKITETDAVGKVQSENIVLLPIEGEDITLTIDSRIQEKMYKAISEMAHNVSFQGGSGLIMDIQNGELLSIVNYPEYDSNILSEGKDKQKINSFLDDKSKVFLNRSISGLYSPGSIVKPFLAYGALEEEIITPEKEILANGTISIPNPYYPDLKSIFKDHDVFGYVDMRQAISVSSDIYFYEIGGGFEDQQGLGISKIDEYSKMFGLGVKTGIDLKGEQGGLIPDPVWKAKVFDGDPWRVGDTYNTAIGQYGFQVTPIQMVKAVAVLANKGKLFTPHILKEDNEKIFSEGELLLDEDKLNVVFEGMRMAVTEGTCLALNTPQVEVAAKSGTAQVGFGNTNTNSWIIGFFPYQNPRYAFALVMERGPKSASGNATWVMRQVVDFMVKETPEYFD